jgi:hypothetical protein
MRDIANNVKTLAAIVPVVVTADTNGVDIDLQGFNKVMLVLNIGIEGDTLSGSVKFDYILQEAPDDGTGSAGTYVIVTDNNLVTANTVDSSGIFATVDADAEIPAVHKIGYVGNKRFIRLVIDATGTHTNGTPHSCVAILSQAGLAPVA